MAIRRCEKKQALEGTLNVKKRLAIKTDLVQFIVWGKLKAYWAGQSKVSLDSCSLQLLYLRRRFKVQCKWCCEERRMEGKDRKRCLKTDEWSNW